MDHGMATTLVISDLGAGHQTSYIAYQKNIYYFYLKFLVCVFGCLLLSCKKEPNFKNLTTISYQPVGQGRHFHAEYLFILRKLVSAEAKNRIILEDSCFHHTKIYFLKKEFP
jgi:hypothetical protein